MGIYDFTPPSPEAREAVHVRARRIIAEIGPEAAEWFAEALLVYAQEAQGRRGNVMLFITDDATPWRIAVTREPRMRERP